jgi:transposase, IS30 family
MNNKKYTQLNQFERDRLEALLNAGHKQENIAKVLERPPSTISREIKRNKLEKDGKNKKKGEYKASTAGIKAHFKRKYAKYQGKKINQNNELRTYIVNSLKKYRNPDEIAGRMKKKKKPFYASKTAIYTWLYSAYGQRYCKYLKFQRYNPKKRKTKKDKKYLIPNRTGIELRPEIINEKQVYGHYEGDTIVSGKKTRSKTSLAVIYERKAKHINIRKISSLKPKNFNIAIKSFAKKQKISSLTLDNGIENRYHQQLRIKTYFCKPYSSWQKGGVEHANSMIRRFIPKGSNIDHYSDEYVKMIEDTINNKPRKSLGYKTPNEIMIENNLFIKNKKFRRKKIALRG